MNNLKKDTTSNNRQNSYQAPQLQEHKEEISRGVLLLTILTIIMIILLIIAIAEIISIKQGTFC